MVTGICLSPIYKLYKVYNEYEERIKKTKWYEFSLRSRLKNELNDLRSQGAITGFNMALKDLEEFGIIKKV